MTRRTFLSGSTAAAITTRVSPLSSQGLSTNTPATMPPKTMPTSVAGIRIVDSTIAAKATDLSQRVSPPYLFNHAMRTYLFASLMGNQAGLRFDAELLYLACVLHDLGLTSKFEGDAPFEIQGANTAKTFLIANGLGAEKAEIVWDGIAMHPLAISGYKKPEIALVAVGAGADVVGNGLQKLQRVDVAMVVAAFPRLEFKTAFIRTCAEIVQRHPSGAGGTFMQGIGEQEVKGFVRPNICPLIVSAPFAE